jgi:hypothetical protein
MSDAIRFMISAPVISKNAGGHWVSLHVHFIERDSNTRVEADGEQQESDELGKPGKFVFYWPLIEKSHQAETRQFINTLRELVALCHESVKPIRICKRKRSNCGFCFKGLFGQTEQMGMILSKTFEGEHKWIPSGPHI